MLVKSMSDSFSIALRIKLKTNSYRYSRGGGRGLWGRWVLAYFFAIGRVCVGKTGGFCAIGIVRWGKYAIVF